jgi:hypothetical protein
MVRLIPGIIARYPALADWIAHELPRVEESAQIWNAFLDAASVNPFLARDLLAGQGSALELALRPLSPTLSAYTAAEPGLLVLASDIAEHFEIAPGDAGLRTLSLSALLRPMVLWRSMVVGRTASPAELDAFEARAFGSVQRRSWDADLSIDYTEQSSKRGIRNNNPGNIVRGQQWKGLALPEEMTPTQLAETVFDVFRTAKWGIRALARVLENYQQQHGLMTVAAMISRFAPPYENDTAAYISAVAEAMGIDPGAPFHFEDEGRAIPMLTAIIHHENGEQPYPSELIREGWLERST